MRYNSQCPQDKGGLAGLDDGVNEIRTRDPNRPVRGQVVVPNALSKTVVRRADWENISVRDYKREKSELWPQLAVEAFVERHRVQQLLHFGSCILEAQALGSKNFHQVKQCTCGRIFGSTIDRNDRHLYMPDSRPAAAPRVGFHSNTQNFVWHIEFLRWWDNAHLIQVRLNHRRRGISSIWTELDGM